VTVGEVTGEREQQWIASQGARAAASVEQRRGARRRGRGWLMRRMLLTADVVGLALAFLLTEAVFGSAGAPDAFGLWSEVVLFVATLPVWLLGAKLFGLYDRDEERADNSTSDDLVRVFLLATVGVFALTHGLSLAGVADPDLLKLMFFWGLVIALVTAARIGARTVARKSAAYVQNTVVVGAGDVGQLIARKLLQHPEYGINVVGLVDAQPKERRADLQDLTILGSLGELRDIVKRFEVDRVIFAFSNESHRPLVALIRSLRDAGVQVDVVPRLFDVIGPKLAVHPVEGLPLIGLAPVRIPRSSRLIKRSIDLVGAAVGLMLASPLFVIFAIWIKRDSPGPVFFRQTRLGKDMCEVRVLKFRTMRVDTDEAAHRDYIAATMSPHAAVGGNGLYKLDRASEVTSVGRWLRKTSLDELPQLWNVLRGEMSLVGPRPCLRYEVEHFSSHHFDRFLVPAGMTGLWQVSARAHSTFGEALDLDVLYAHSWSIGLDLSLLARTPLQLLRPRTTA
jgi:exopolysaccharide biosynthesis polyprenyl glycosylphosphotransferase